MVYIIIIVSLIIIAYINIKVISLIINYLVNRTSNSFLRNLFITIQLIILGVSMTLTPIIIGKYYPKSEAQIKGNKLREYSDKAREYSASGKFEIAYSYYDSAEKYSTNNLFFHTDKSLMKYYNGEYNAAIKLINRLIAYNELNNIYETHLYEIRSMYYFINQDYENAIFDLNKVISSDSLYNEDFILQISMIHLINDNYDSAFRYIIKAENVVRNFGEGDFDEYLKELNLLKSIYYQKTNDKDKACLYFKEYDRMKATKIYYNYLYQRFKRDLINEDDIYKIYFKNELNSLINTCYK